MGGKRLTPNQGLRNFNDATKTWKEKPNFNWGRTQTFTNLQNGSIFVYSSSYQIKLEKALLDFDSNQEKSLSHLRTQLGQQQDDMIGKINLLWKIISEKLNDVSTPENAGNSMAHKSIAAESIAYVSHYMILEDTTSLIDRHLGEMVFGRPFIDETGLVYIKEEGAVMRIMVEFLGAIPINLKCNMWESEDLIKKPINWDKPPKNRDGAWHAKIRLIDPDGEEFTKTLQ
ncbi:hypothetical protein Tco_0564043 [Tanacetum coccineum]